MQPDTDRSMTAEQIDVMIADLLHIKSQLFERAMKDNSLFGVITQIDRVIVRLRALKD